MAGFGVHFHDHAWHMRLCGCLGGGIIIIFCVDALVAGIISGSCMILSILWHGFLYFEYEPIWIRKLTLRVRLVREFGRGGRGREIFNLMCLVQFLEGEGSKFYCTVKIILILI